MERDKAHHLDKLTVAPMNRDDSIFDHCEQHHFPASYSSNLKAQCPYFKEESLGRSSMCNSKTYDLKRHLMNVYKLVDVAQYGLAEHCRKVMEEAPKRPLFQPISEQSLMTAFARGLAVHKGAIVNALLPVV